MSKETIESYQRQVALCLLTKQQNKAFDEGRMRDYKVWWHCWNIVFWNGISRTSMKQHEDWLEEMTHGTQST